MTTYACNIDGCEYETDNPDRLRSHIGAKSDDEHQEATERRAWKDWYPDAYGVKSHPEEESEGTSEEGTEGSEGTSEEADVETEYQEQWDRGTSEDPESGDADGADDPDEEPPEGGLSGALVVGAGVAAVGLLLALNGSDDSDAPKDPNQAQQAIEQADQQPQAGAESPLESRFK